MTAICITKRKAHKYDISETDLAGELVEPNGLSQNGLSQNGYGDASRFHGFIIVAFGFMMFFSTSITFLCVRL